MVLAMQDDQFLQTASHVEFSVEQIAEVSRSQKRAIAVIAQISLEHFTGLIGTSPITLRDVWSGHPDFPFGPFRTAPASFCVDNQHTLTGTGWTTTHDLAP